MKKIVFTMVLPAVMSLVAVSTVAKADDQCAANVKNLVSKPAYRDLNADLSSAVVKSFTQLLKATVDQTSYDALLAQANTLASGVGSTGRVLITLPDGTVVVDTKKGATNTYANFGAKTINENHNSRIAILDAQLYPCGLGAETKFSTSDNTTEVYVAKRLGGYLKSTGTVRLSK